MTKENWTSFEPHLDEMFADPIVTAVMRRDGLTERDMRDTLSRARRSTSLPRHGHGSLPLVVSAWSF
jgi:hypothetical protein